MISFLSSWAEQIIVAVVIATIIEMILPENNNKKYIKLITGIYILFTIISPFISKNTKLDLNKIEENVSKATVSEEKVNQESMDYRINELYIEQIEKDITNKVEAEGYIVKKCKVDIELDEKSDDKGIKKITLKIEKNSNTVNKDNEKSAVNKIEITVGLDKYVKNKEDDSQITSEEINKLKNTLSDYYQIEVKKINITKD